MPSVSMRQLLEAGVHFGHQTRRWNPKMKPYIFAERNGIHIIDLAQTVNRLDAALRFVTDTVASGDYVLFVGTKKQAQEPVADEASRAEMPYVNHRWLGGMLTNFVTIRKRIGLLDQLEARQANGELDRLSKKEASKVMEDIARLQLKLGGVRKMRRLPGAIFVVDPQRERIAVTEARRLEIPVIGTGDTNVDPDQIDYIIPANDDAIRAIRLLCRLVADAAVEGLAQRAVRAAEEPPMGADVSEAEEASDEVMAAIAAGGTYSFAPEPDEDESLLPGEELEIEPEVEASIAELPAAVAVQVDEEAEQPAKAARPRARKSSAKATEADAEPADEAGVAETPSDVAAPATAAQADAEPDVAAAEPATAAQADAEPDVAAAEPATAAQAAAEPDVAAAEPAAAEHAAAEPAAAEPAAAEPRTTNTTDDAAASA
jgi:small subunit ribosomal protein S2